MKQKETNSIEYNRKLYQMGEISSYKGESAIDNYIKTKKELLNSCSKPILTEEMKQQLNEEIEKAIDELLNELNIK